MVTLSAALFLVLVQTPGQAAKLPEYTGPKKRAAVSGFDVKIGSVIVTARTPSGNIGSISWNIAPGLQPGTELESIPAEAFGTGLTDVLVTSLIDSKRFVVLERPNLADITAEIERGKTGAFAPDTVASEGKLLGAQVLFRGAITEMSYKKSSGISGGGVFGAELNVGKTSYTATTGIELKMVDVQTGQVLDSVHAEGKVTSRNSVLGFGIAGLSFGNEAFEASPLGKSVREAIKAAVEKLCARADKMPWEARVASVGGQGTADSPRLLYLNFGKDSGIAVGTELEVFKRGEVVIDPETKLVLGREDDTSLGLCKIRTVGDKLSVAIFTGSGAVEPGCGVRLSTKQIK